MTHEFTAVIEPPDDEDPFWVATCPELPGANGQGESEQEALDSLREAIRLLLEVRLEQGLQGIKENAKQAVVSLT
ncbi:MAG: type II toxin-antitoxin system HicB family antitoxin [Planctomycetota bacterium]